MIYCLAFNRLKDFFFGNGAKKHKYVCYHKGLWLAVDNSCGMLWNLYFDSFQDAVDWLRIEPMDMDDTKLKGA